MVIAPTVKLNNGLEMPAFGLGTLASNGNVGVQAVRDAIDAGYRHFDCAYLYRNEKEVGQGILEKMAEGVVKREEIFYVSKLWNNFHRAADVERLFRKSLENSGLDYIDLFLIHFPIAFVRYDDANLWPKNADGTFEVDNETDYLDTWRELEKLVEAGLVRSIGLSNFNSEQIDRVLSIAKIKPVVNQVECSPTLNQKQLISFCKERSIVVTAYSPLGWPNIEKQTPAHIFDKKVVTIAEKHGKSTAQIVLRYLFQLGAVPIPKSVTKERIEQNINIFDFSLSDNEVKIIDSFHTGERLVGLPETKNSIHYPFAIPF